MKKFKITKQHENEVCLLVEGMSKDKVRTEIYHEQLKGNLKDLGTLFEVTEMTEVENKSYTDSRLFENFKGLGLSDKAAEVATRGRNGSFSLKEVEGTKQTEAHVNDLPLIKLY